MTRQEKMEAALRDLLQHVDNETCRHESTSRGGSIWTICDECEQKWADDRGGFQPYQDAPAVAAARAALSEDRVVAEPVAMEPFRMGNAYRTQGGEIVRFVSISNAGETYETMADQAGVHRYTQRDFGRVTGSPHDYSDPRNVPPLYRAPPDSAPSGDAVREALDKTVHFAECETPEPTLRKMILGYYMQGIGLSGGEIDLAKDYTDRFIRALSASGSPGADVGRGCTCHPDDNPPQPCPQKFAYSECVKASDQDQSVLLARVASVICEETCGLTSECKSREAAKVLFDKGYLRTRAPDATEAVAWLETFYEEGGGKETIIWLTEPLRDDSTIKIEPLYLAPPPSGDAVRALSKIAHYSPASTVQPVAIAREALINLIGGWDRDTCDAALTAPGASVGQNSSDGGLEGQAGARNSDSEVPVASDSSPSHHSTIETCVRPAAGIKPGPSEAKEAFEDMRTHRDAWRDALVLARDNAEIIPPDIDDHSYWQHELDVFDRTFNTIVVGPSDPTPQDAKCQTCNGHGEVSQFVGSIGSGGEGWQVDPCPDCNSAPQDAKADAGEQEMSLRVALDFAEHPRRFSTLEAPADSMDELYEALGVLAKVIRTLPLSASKPVTVEEIARVLCDHDLYDGAWDDEKKSNEGSGRIFWMNEKLRPYWDRASAVEDTLINARTSGVE